MSLSPPCNRICVQADQNRGVALILVLALLAIVSFMLVAFVTMTRLDRQATFSYSQSLKAERLGLGGLQIVLSELQQEMGKDAAPDLTYPLKPLYTNVTSANIMPQVTVGNGAPSSLVKVSAPTPSFSGPRASGTLLSSDVPSTASSKNNRSVSLRRWNQAFLGEFTDSAAAPRWVTVTRNGPVNASLLSFKSIDPRGINNPKSSNPNFVIGRFAYAVYDVGGLLDIKVAGYPSKLKGSELQSIKGTLAGADVSALGIDADPLVEWRNAASYSDYSRYITNFLSANGVGKIYPGDTTFLSRQDLIKAAHNRTAGLTPEVLQHLTVFTRERNSPSWHPQTPTGSTIDYATLANTVTSTTTNLFIPLVRHQTSQTITSYRVDGSSFTYPVEPGDPVVYHRFPLDRIRWLGPSGPQNGGTAASIQACFGLLWDASNGLWKYVGPTGSSEQSSIKTLSLVSDEKREANFFELLQAGILSGSLAQNNGNPVGGAGFSNTHQKFTAIHLFRIGASIISQYDSTAYPCVIEYNQSGQGWRACGTKSLPYFNFVKLLGGASPDDAATSLANFFLLSLWNPHQSITSFNETRPPIRIHLQGPVALANQYTAYPINNYGGLLWRGTFSANDATITLSQAANKGVNGFAEPALVKVSDTSTSVGAGTTAGLEWTSVPALDSTSNTYLGYRLPDFVIDPSIVPPAAQKNNAEWRFINAFIGYDTGQKPFTISLEFQTPSGIWVPYTYWNGINNNATWFKSWQYQYTAYLGYHTTAVAPLVNNPPSPPPFQITTAPSYNTSNYKTQFSQPPTFFLADPRSIRFNPIQLASVNRDYLNSPFWGPLIDPFFQDNGLGGSIAAPFPGPYENYTAIQQAHYISSSPINTATGPYYPGWLCRNNQDVAGKYTAYADRDGVKRKADSGLFTTAPKSNGWEGNPYARTIDRPIILNRPFNHVAELGYVSRDYPWKTLDFFTSASADAGLLDLFTVNQNTDPVQSGRVNLNGRDPTIFTALLKNTQTDAIARTSVGNPTKIAANLLAYTAPTGTTRFTSKEQIANQFVAGLAADSFSNKDEQSIKARREAIVRALSDVGQTRTWNLMIDIVAQAGRYTQNAKSLEEFTVEGERRFWLHVAIDRFTGEIIDQQLEPYNN